MKIIILNLLIFLCFVISTNAEVYTTPDGYKVEIKLVLDKSEIMLDEPMWFSLEIKNISDVEIGVVEGGMNRNKFGRPDSFSISAIDSNEKSVKKVDAGGNFGGVIGIVKILPEETHKVRFLTSHWINFEKTGNFSLLCQKQIIIQKYSYNILNSLKFTKTPVNVNARISVKPNNYNQMGFIINSYGQSIFDKPYKESMEAVKALSFINDKRVVKYFVKLIDLISSNDKKFYEFRYYAFRPLAKFNDQNAFKAIIKNINSSDETIRRAISYTLSNSVHPQAEKYLLSMRTDKSSGIRLDVVHYLGKRKTAKSTGILQSMLNDESKMVRDEAKRYLEERGFKIN